MEQNELVRKMAVAIATFEGFYVTPEQARVRGIAHPTLAQRNNNPGNLRSWGKNRIVGGYAKFPTAEAGWKALFSQIRKNIGRGLTLREFFGGKPGVYPGYAPSADKNDPTKYATFVADTLGIGPDVVLRTLIT